MRWTIHNKLLFFTTVLTIIIVLVLLYYTVFYTQPPLVSGHRLGRDGIQRFHQVADAKTVAIWKQLIRERKHDQMFRHVQDHNPLRQLIDRVFSPEYELQDYYWVIEKAGVHTCHRDNNSLAFNRDKGQRYPSYTMIMYLEPMERAIGVIPGSHIKSHGLNKLEELACDSGDIVIFDANLIHVGTVLDKRDHLRVQMKITHKDDRKVLAYYEDFHKVQQREPNMPQTVRKIQRDLSCAVPQISDWTQTENIRTARGSSKGVDIGWKQRMFSTLLYGSPNFYDLKDS